MGAIFGRTLNASIISSQKSYLIAFIIISLMMILFLGDIKLGLISMISNLLPILYALAFLYTY